VNSTLTLWPDVLAIDAAETADKIEAAIRDMAFKQLKRKGVVIGLSGGIDSSTAAALCVRALGPERVFGLFMPEADSSGDSVQLGRQVADWLGIRAEMEDIRPILEAAGCYRRRDEAIRLVVPEYKEGYKSKIVLANVMEDAAYSVFSLVVEAPDGSEFRTRLSLEAYLGIVAATNFKQRARKMMEYYYADRFHYSVAGTPNRLEYDQGFFVKNGDGAADLKPIAHLYKTQVYQLAEYLGIPEDVRRRPPTTDTYSLEQSQEEFFFLLPYHQMDLCLYAKDHNVPPEDVAKAAGLTRDEVQRAYRMIDSKRRATRYLHAPALLVEEIGWERAQSRTVI
jgi:NAD+ synthase